MFGVTPCEETPFETFLNLSTSFVSSWGLCNKGPLLLWRIPSSQSPGFRVSKGPQNILPAMCWKSLLRPASSSHSVNFGPDFTFPAHSAEVIHHHAKAREIQSITAGF